MKKLMSFLTLALIAMFVSTNSIAQTTEDHHSKVSEHKDKVSKHAAALKDGAGSGQYLGNYLSQFLPQRLARDLTSLNFPNKQIKQLTKQEIEQIGRGLNDWQVKFRETEGYDRAEVTLGGVSTDELSSRSMESKKNPGLYFIGEVVDVTGWLGGYNFQWAWSSGFAAGAAI